MNRLKIAAGILLAIPLLALAGDKVVPDQVNSLAIMFQVVTQFKAAIGRHDLDPVHNEDAFISASINEMLAETIDVSSNKIEAFKTDLITLGQRAGDLHAAADAGEQALAESDLRKVISAFRKVCRYFPRDIVMAARKNADIYTCPMHRDIRGKSTDTCPLCGMALDQMVRLLPTASDVDTSGQAIRASVRTDGPLTVGRPVKVYLRLTKADGFPVCLPDLIETHTKKIHLLIIDPSLSDYHHEHPEPTDKLGEYVFTFTPSKPGGYRVWADIRPYPLGLQEYVMADIPATTVDPPLTDRSLNDKVTVDGLNYELLLDTRTIRVGIPAHARLRITTLNGNGFRQLEPVMATFAHIVGFNEDYKTVMHIHPTGQPVLDPNARGGPELKFQIYALQPGFVRLFAQIQVNGKPRFAPFGIQVEP